MSFLEEDFGGSPHFTHWQQLQGEQSPAVPHVGQEEAGAAPGPWVAGGLGHGCSSIVQEHLVGGGCQDLSRWCWSLGPWCSGSSDGRKQFGWGDTAAQESLITLLL